MRFRLIRLSLLLLVISIASCSEQKQPSADQSAATSKTTQPPNADDIVQQLASFYAKQKTVQVDCRQTTSVLTKDAENNSTLKRSFVIEKPNRVAIRSSGQAGFDLISNGETLVTYISVLKKYTEGAAPDSCRDILQDPMLAGMTGGTGLFALHLVEDDPYTALMEGVTAKKYVGNEQLNGVNAHRLKFIQDQFDWEIWVQADGDPLVLKVATDMSKSMKQQYGGFADGEFSMTVTVEFSNWKMSQTLGSDAFVFHAPEGVSKVESFFEGFGATEPSPLLGEAAPTFTLPMLDGSEMDLKNHANQQIVMIDFWATWCGPCVKELPLLAEIAEEYAEKGVVFYAVNSGEDSETIRNFLKEEKLNVTVALDENDEVSDSYGITGIPALFLIDKKGIVQAVHVGYSPDIKKTLKKELDDLLEGKELAQESLKSRKDNTKEVEAPEAFGLKEAWSLAGGYSGIAVDVGEKIIVACRTGGKCDVFDAEGQQLRSFEVKGVFDTLRPAHLSGDRKIELLGFQNWDEAVTAFTMDGTVLWTERSGNGIDDVWAQDLDGDKFDEVIVGYNGGTGLHVFEHDGGRRWEYNKIGNVWHVAAGDVDGDGTPNVVSTSAAGKIHIFDADGNLSTQFDAGLYASMVRVGPPAKGSKADRIYTIGSKRPSEAMAALNREGEVRWTLEFPKKFNHCDSFRIANRASWGAVGLRDGMVAIVDLNTGNIIAAVYDQGERPEVAWYTSESSKSPLLLVATGRSLNAYQVDLKVK